MAIHSAHESIGTHGLADDCERCQEHAERPFDSLDDNNFYRVVMIALGREEPKTDLDRLAARKVKEVITLHSRIARALLSR